MSVITIVDTPVSKFRLLSHLRYLTYAFLLAALWLSINRSIGLLPVELAQPPYEKLARDYLKSRTSSECLELLALDFDEILLNGEKWAHQEGVDFHVWYLNLKQEKTSIGAYIGMQPQVISNTQNLIEGKFCGVPVLWSPKIGRDYQKIWEALIPCRIGTPSEAGRPPEEYLHVWIVSYSDEAIRKVARQAEDMRILKMLNRVTGGE